MQRSVSLWTVTYAAKFITSTLRKNFLPTRFQFTRTVERETHTHHMPQQKLRLITVGGKYQCDEFFMRPTFCQSNFLAVRHSATRFRMQKPCQSRTALTSTLFLAFAAWQSDILLQFALRYRVDALLQVM